MDAARLSGRLHEKRHRGRSGSYHSNKMSQGAARILDSSGHNASSCSWDMFFGSLWYKILYYVVLNTILTILIYYTPVLRFMQVNYFKWFTLYNSSDGGKLMSWCRGQKVFWPLWYRIAPHFVLPQSSKTFKIRPDRAPFSCFWRIPGSKILLQASLHRISDLLTLVSCHCSLSCYQIDIVNDSTL